MADAAEVHLYDPRDPHRPDRRSGYYAEGGLGENPPSGGVAGQLLCSASDVSADVPMSMEVLNGSRVDVVFAEYAPDDPRPDCEASPASAHAPEPHGRSANRWSWNMQRGPVRLHRRGLSDTSGDLSAYAEAMPGSVIQLRLTVGRRGPDARTSKS